jgi:hypothetical protein
VLVGDADGRAGVQVGQVGQVADLDLGWLAVLA